MSQQHGQRRRYTLKPERLGGDRLRLLYKHDPGALLAQRPLPASVDLRPRCPPVYDQGQVGSCTANAIGAAVQFLEPAFMPSRLFLYYNERLADGDVDQDGGSTLSQGVLQIAQLGLCPESAWPYDESKVFTKPSRACYASALRHKFPHHAHVIGTDELKRTLASGHPVVLGLLLFESFETVEVARSGMVPMPGPHEQMMGGHAVTCVGYREDGRFIFRNSWGAGWGDHGYFYLPEQYLRDERIASDFWVVLP